MCDSLLQAEQAQNVESKAHSAHLAHTNSAGCVWLKAGTGNMALHTFTFW